MSDKLVCENCKHYKPVSGNEGGLCRRVDIFKLFIPAQSSACAYFVKGRKTVKPRRLCDFCERKKLIDDEYGRCKIGCMKLIPLPAINLTTGEKSEPKRNVEYSMFVYESDDDRGEFGSFPIKFCPYCGRKLGGEKDG